MYHGEKFNAWTHLVGALLALTGAIWLIVVAAGSGDGWKIFSMVVYGVRDNRGQTRMALS